MIWKFFAILNVIKMGMIAFTTITITIVIIHTIDIQIVKEIQIT